MITSAAEFIKLRTSAVMEEYQRAAHEEAPLAVWWELVHDHPDMKVWVVHNKTVPLEILAALSTDEDASIRSAIARKGKASFEILDRLSQDPDEGVRLSVAYNETTSLEILKRMLDDDWEMIVDRVKARIREAEGG